MAPESPAAAQVESHLERYSRQILFQPLGSEAQRKLLAARATLIGCGALGTVIADTLVRAGLGFLRIVDRDYIEPNNLQRQVLFDEQDIADGLPKAAAAAAKLARINSEVSIEPIVADASHANIEAMLEGSALLLDGTDNFETRFLMNDAAVKRGIPWIYGACVSSTGMVMPILPHETPCLRCIWQEPPPPGTGPTCDTAGVLAPIVHVVAALQCVEAIKLLTGNRALLNRGLTQIDVWTGRFDTFDMLAARDPDCPCCGRGRYDFLAAGRSGGSASLCGRNAVQVFPSSSARPDLDAVAARVARIAAGPVRQNRYLLRFAAGIFEITLFADGRAIIKGTPDPQEARSVYAKYIGA